MSNVGFATLQVIPSMRGVKANLDREMSGPATAAGAQAGDRASSGFLSRFAPALARVGVAAFAGLAAAGTAVVGTGLKIAADMEQADIAFTTMLGSGEKAKAFLDELKKFAAQTPFEFPELQKAASSLIAAGFEASKVIPIMTTLGNVTSGMGTGSEGVQRATVALQQMSAAGKITGEDLNQLRDAGVPVFDLLTAATGRTKEEIAAMAQSGKLGRGEMEALFKALETGKGLERFNGLMEKQSQSLLGLLSSLKDNVGQALAGMMAPVVDSLKGQLPAITKVIGDALGTIGPDITTLATGLISALSSILPSLVPILGAVAGALGEVFKTIAPAVATILPSFLRIITALLPILPSLAKIFVALAPGLAIVAELFAQIVEAIPPAALTAIAAALLLLFSQVAAGIAIVAGLALAAKFVISNWDKIAGFFIAMWEQVKAVFNAGVEFVRGLIDNWFRILLAIATGGLSEIIGFFVRHWDKIKELVSGAVAAVVGFIVALPGRAIAGLVVGVPAIIGFFKELPGKIIGAFGDATKLLFNVGKDIIRGLVNGIKSLPGAVGDALKGVAGGAVKGVKGLLGIGSPSKVFAEIGSNVVKGFVLGVEGGRSDISRAFSVLDPSDALAPTVVGSTLADAGGSSAPGVLSESQLRAIIRDELDITMVMDHQKVAQISGRELDQRRKARRRG